MKHIKRNIVKLKYKNERDFLYMVELGDCFEHEGCPNEYNNYRYGPTHYLYNDSDCKALYVRSEGGWVEKQDIPHYNHNIPDRYNVRNITVYFPDYRLTNYVPQAQYIIEIELFFRGKRLVLDSILVNEKDLEAVSVPFKEHDNVYYNKFEFQILDPQQIFYSSDWADWRREIMGYEFPSPNENNIIIKMYPVQKDEHNVFRIANGCVEGYNGLPLKELQDVGLRAKMEVLPGTGVLIKLAGDERVRLKKYLAVNYGLNESDIELQYKFDLTFMHADTIYGTPLSNPEPIPESYYIFKPDDLGFNGWSGYQEGVLMVGGITIYINYGSEPGSTMFFKTNYIPLVPDTYKYLMNSTLTNKIDLDKLEMNIYNIHAVQKEVKQVVQMSSPNPIKPILQPVFFRAHEGTSILVHENGGIENICINLDIYKSKVKTFILKIGTQMCTEIGRVPAGIIFKILGSKLPKTPSGTYYIYNENSELVTTGKYNIE